eukprot:gene24930-biopygen23939
MAVSGIPAGIEKLRGRDKYGRGTDKLPFQELLGDGVSGSAARHPPGRNCCGATGVTEPHSLLASAVLCGALLLSKERSRCSGRTRNSGGTLVAASAIACSHSPVSNRCALSHVAFTSDASGSKSPMTAMSSSSFTPTIKSAREARREKLDSRTGNVVTLHRIGAPSVLGNAPTAQINGRLAHFEFPSRHR